MSVDASGISAFVVCKNEAANIDRCLASLAWCNEIVVVDSGSTDGTLEICAKHGARVVHRDWTGYVDQKAHGLSLCSQPWILNLDADEEVSPELCEEIKAILRRDADGRVSENGFELLRVVFYLGRWWRLGGWHPEWRLRLARREKVTWHGEEPHEHARVPGAVSRLHGELRHYTYRDIVDQVARMNSHTSAAARSLHAKGRRAGLSDLLLKPKARFFKFYILRKGWREGFPGFLVACMEAVSVYLKYFKLWELNRRN
ncbi:MAG: glycosyltransferase family 2 protein [Terrimicrobiaceae bacterium]